MRKSHLDVKSKSQKAMESSERAWVEGGGRTTEGHRGGLIFCVWSLWGVSFGTSYRSDRIWLPPHVPGGVAASHSPGASPAFRSRNVPWPQVTRASRGAYSDLRWSLPPWRRLSQVFSFPPSQVSGTFPSAQPSATCCPIGPEEQQRGDTHPQALSSVECAAVRRWKLGPQRQEPRSQAEVFRASSTGSQWA